MEELAKSIQTIATYASLILGILITLRSFIGFFMGGHYTNADKLFANVFIVTLYIQFFIELYFFLTSTLGYEDSLKATEHIALTLFATIMTQGGRIITLKSSDDSVKFRFRSIYYGLATGLLVYAYILMS